MKEGFVFKVSQGESQTTRLFFLHDHGEATREPLYLHNCIPVTRLCHQAPLSKTERGVCPGRPPECLTWFAQHSRFSLQQRGHLAVVHLEGFWNVCSIPGLRGSGVWRIPVLLRGKTSLPTGGEFLQPAVHLSGAVPGPPGCSWSRTWAFPVHGLHPGGSVCLDCDPILSLSFYKVSFSVTLGSRQPSSLGPSLDFHLHPSQSPHFDRIIFLFWHTSCTSLPLWSLLMLPWTSLHTEEHRDKNELHQFLSGLFRWILGSFSCSWGSFNHVRPQFHFSASGYFGLSEMMPFLKPRNVRQNSLTLKLKHTVFPYKIFVLIKLDILKMLIFEFNSNLETICRVFFHNLI